MTLKPPFIRLLSSAGQIYNDVIDWTVKALAIEAGLQMGQLLLARIANHPARELQLVHEPKLQFIED
jgi:hypothetical protein